MAKRIEEKRMSNSYTRQQRQELTREFNQVLNQCPDKAFGQALAAAARVIKSGGNTSGRG